MKKALFLSVFLLVFVINIPASGQSGAIQEAGSKVTFSISHTTGKVNGTFTGMRGTVRFDEQHPETGSMEATIDAASIDTDNRTRDADLRKKKFFDTEHYPEIHFRSKALSKTANGYQVTGDLTIKDHTKEVTIPFQVQKHGNRQVFTGSLAINRKEFDLGLKSFPPIGKTAQVHITAITE